MYLGCFDSYLRLLLLDIGCFRNNRNAGEGLFFYRGLFFFFYMVEVGRRFFWVFFLRIFEGFFFRNYLFFKGSVLKYYRYGG